MHYASFSNLVLLWGGDGVRSGGRMGEGWRSLRSFLNSSRSVILLFYAVAEASWRDADVCLTRSS